LIPERNLLYSVLVINYELQVWSHGIRWTSEIDTGVSQIALKGNAKDERFIVLLLYCSDLL
jgi:hypothetical protein